MKIKLFLYVLVISSDKVFSDFNFKDHAFKPITALQCNNGSPEIFSNKKDMCKKTKYETKLEPENVVILQRVEQVQTEAYLCQKFESIMDELCGCLLYTSPSPRD